jgi:hypothetical protein
MKRGTEPPSERALIMGRPREFVEPRPREAIYNLPEGAASRRRLELEAETAKGKNRRTRLKAGG